MEVVPAPSRYSEWLDFVFGRIRPGEDPWQLDWKFDASPEDLALLLAHTMQHCGRDLASYSDDQLATGLRALLMVPLSRIAYRLSQAQLPDATKLTVLTSLPNLYANCLSDRSPPVLGHLSETRGSALAGVTYMLWDECPLTNWISVKDDQGRSALVALLGNVLMQRPANPACLESALHGLGHLVTAHPKYEPEIIAQIDAFLASRPIGRPELKTYAAAARKGHIQ